MSGGHPLRPTDRAQELGTSRRAFAFRSDQAHRDQARRVSLNRIFSRSEGYPSGR